MCSRQPARLHFPAAAADLPALMRLPWYRPATAQVLEYSADTGRYLLRYDDGASDWVNLEAERTDWGGGESGAWPGLAAAYSLHSRLLLPAATRKHGPCSPALPLSRKGVWLRARVGAAGRAAVWVKNSRCAAVASASCYPRCACRAASPARCPQRSITTPASPRRQVWSRGPRPRVVEGAPPAGRSRRGRTCPRAWTLCATSSAAPSLSSAPTLCCGTAPR